jgi:hypothetical protein
LCCSTQATAVANVGTGLHSKQQQQQAAFDGTDPTTAYELIWFGGCPDSSSWNSAGAASAASCSPAGQVPAESLAKECASEAQQQAVSEEVALQQQQQQSRQQQLEAAQQEDAAAQDSAAAGSLLLQDAMQALVMLAGPDAQADAAAAEMQQLALVPYTGNVAPSGYEQHMLINNSYGGLA